MHHSLHSALDATTNMLSATIFGLDTNPYGGKSTFSQTTSGEAGDLNFIIFLCVVFPTAATIFLYKDGNDLD